MTTERAPCGPIAFWAFRDHVSNENALVVSQHADVTLRDETGATMLHMVSKWNDIICMCGIVVNDCRYLGIIKYDNIFTQSSRLANHSSVYVDCSTHLVSDSNKYNATK